MDKAKTCPICKSTKVTVDEAGKLVRCGNCGWNRSRVRKSPAN